MPIASSGRSPGSIASSVAFSSDSFAVFSSLMPFAFFFLFLFFPLGVDASRHQSYAIKNKFLRKLPEVCSAAGELELDIIQAHNGLPSTFEGIKHLRPQFIGRAWQCLGLIELRI